MDRRKLRVGGSEGVLSAHRYYFLFSWYRLTYLVAPQTLLLVTGTLCTELLL
jgi:hypothetical protein